MTGFQHLQVHIVYVCVSEREVGVQGRGRLLSLDSALLGLDSALGEMNGPERQGNPLFELRKPGGQ